LFYPFTKNKSGSNGVSRITCMGMDSTLIIQGKSYNNVVRFEIDVDGFKEKNCPIYLNTIYYWSRDVGLIKKQVVTCNHSWELIEYKIIN
jgi:hypothetical protein